MIAIAILSSGFAPAGAEELVAARNIRAGDILVAEDFETPEERSALHQATTLIGLEAARSIYRGQPIKETDLRTPTIVDRNDIVTMEFARGPLFIASEGRALDKGGVGQRIRVMNLVSKRVVSATIVGGGKVRTIQ